MNKNPRILFILHMPPPVHGAAMVGKYIHDSKIVNEAFDCRFENMMLASSLEDIGKGGIKKVKALFAQLVRFKKAIKEFKPDMVYITPNAAGGAFYKDFVVVQYIKHCLKKYVGKHVPILLHYHNKGVSTKQDRFLDNFLYKKFFKDVKVMLLADVLYNDVKKYVARENVVICPNGIPESIPTSTSLKEHGDGIPQILFLSNLIISKGVLVLLEALKILKEQDIQFNCTFVGGETDELNGDLFNKEVEKRNLQGDAIYVGKKYGDEKQAYFEKADIFAFPTFYHNEAFPLVNLEAMEQKIPVVSTDEGGIPGMIDHGVTGLICQRKSPESLAETLKKLILDKDLRKKMGEAGYKKFKSEFTLDAFEKNFVNSLKTIM